MATLPARPNLSHLRRQARDVLRAAQSGDISAVDRIRAVSDRLTLAAAQLAVAREYGFTSWAGLKAEVEARTMNLAQQVEAFCTASIRDWTGRAARMLAATPEIAGYSFATAVILGDAGRVRREIKRRPDLVTRPDDRTGWTALHAACGSQWHRLDPARADGLLTVARLLLDAGADPRARAGQADGWTPLRCAVAGAANPPITRLLLERGAVPEDHDLYLAGFADDDHECLRLLLGHTADVAEIARTALSAPISRNDLDGVRLLLGAGADPRRYDDGNAPPCPAVYDAVRSACSPELVDLLLARDADPDAPGPDLRSPYALATAQGRTEVAALLRRHGAVDDATYIDRFLSACLHADHAGAHRQVTRHPELPGRLTSSQRAGAIVQAAEAGNTAAVSLMLDLGFPVDARGGEDGGTALHAAAYCGSASTARLLIDRGADIEARDTHWDSPPLDWAVVGSGEKPVTNPRPDWIATVRILIEAGASTQSITLSPDDPKPPSPEVAELLRGYGIA
ncbi:MAG: ankyrin repeat domain-containing protein [Streptosporangiaceae bacterium]